MLYPSAATHVTDLRRNAEHTGEYFVDFPRGKV